MDSYKGWDEIRRINVVYFLSRGGNTEHPHLIRVNHLHRPGVRLRDVKRWLSELRGKDMPDAFSWSYKRKYKAGYVWQDLMDDDLITPISDNEYVLKGCDLPPLTSCIAPHAQKLLDDNIPKVEVAGEEQELKTPGDQKLSEEIRVEADSDEVMPKPPPIDQDSPGESARHTIVFKIDLSQELQQKQQQEEKAVTETAAREEEQVGKPVGKSRSMRVSQVFQNILTCGAVETNDAALRPIQRQRQQRVGGDDESRTPRCPSIEGCGFQKGRSRRGGKEEDTRDGEKGAGVAYKPAGAPYCSQCGKAFKPEKLHSHMKSCKVLKERMKASTNTENNARRPESRSREYSKEASSGSAVFLLTQS